MPNKQLLHFIQKSIEKGHTNKQISSALLEQGWDDDEVNKAILKTQEIIPQKKNTLTAPPAPKKTERSIDFKNLNASQILLYIGGIIIFIAGLIYLGINWKAWGSGARIIAILLPTIALYGIGIPLWFGKKYHKESLIFIITGSLLFPIFLSVTFKELNVFATSWNNNFGLTVSLLTFGLYATLSSIFRFSLWSLLCSVAGLFVYYYFLKVLGIKDFPETTAIAWAFLLLGILYFFLGYFFEIIKKRDYSKYPYAIGTVTIFGSLFLLAGEGRLLKTFMEGFDSYHARQYMTGWSTIIAGIVYLLFGWFSEKLKKMKLDEAGKYMPIFNYVGTVAILGAILYMGTEGKKPAYETLLLISSLGFIFASIPKVSRPFLHVGTIFLVIYIFSIGSEYFHDKAGWPITLFIIGLISMGIGVGIEKLRRQYFINKP